MSWFDILYAICEVLLLSTIAVGFWMAVLIGPFFLAFYVSGIVHKYIVEPWLNRRSKRE